MEHPARCLARRAAGRNPPRRAGAARPRRRLAWTNEEGGDAGQVTTVTFEERGGTTRVTLCERYPSKEALDAARASGAETGTIEAFVQLEELVATLGASPGGH